MSLAFKVWLFFLHFCGFLGVILKILIVLSGEEIEADTTSNVEDGFNGNGKEEIGSNFHDLPPSDDKQQILKGTI